MDEDTDIKMDWSQLKESASSGNEVMAADKNEDNDEIEDESSDEDNAFDERAQELEKQILDNKFLYESHVELVGIYKKQADLKSMRLAYERFHETFPLTDVLWLDWIQVEIKLAIMPAEKRNIIALFDRAVKDYLSVKVWLEYAQFAVGCCEISETRTILNKALAAVGRHITKGSLLWDNLREIELAHLSIATPDSKEFKEQLDKVVDVFKRQLSVPLLNMKETYLEWKEFINLYADESINEKVVDWGYKKALIALDTYKPFEDKLIEAEADADVYQIFKDYIRFVKDPVLNLCLHERAVEQLCLDPKVWIDYCNYAIKLCCSENQIDLAHRAVRNVNWFEDLWVVCLRMLEVAKAEQADVLKFFDEGIALIGSNLNFWVAYLEYAKRNFDDAGKLYKLFTQAEAIDDKTYKIMRLHARILAKNGCIEDARKLWGKILHDPQIKTFAHYLIEYSYLEKQFGTPQQLRVLFGKSLTSCKDFPQLIAEEWLMFERESGTLEDVLKCLEKVDAYLIIKEPIIKAIVEKRKSNYNKSKPVLEFDKQGQRLPQNRKRSADFDAFDAKKPKLFKPKDASGRNQGIPEDLDPNKSVFLSNITPVITQTRINELFPNGKATLATDIRGESRCFAYIQFESEAEADDALQRDRELVDERPIFISKCKTDHKERRKVFKFSTNAEETKLFVRGLPTRHTQAEVEAIFKPYNCNNVRIVMHRSGQSKGLAYIDFNNEQDTINAMKATDQMNVNGFVISVALSAPPTKDRSKERMQEGSSRDRFNKRHDAQSAQPYAEVKEKPSRKLSVPLIPRSVQKKEVKDGVSVLSTVAKTNADFRKMLLEK